MRFHGTDIIPVQQPVYLLTGDIHEFIFPFGPFEFFFRQAFVIQHKSGIIPEQTLDFVSPAIGECVQVSSKRVMTQLAFNNSTQSDKALPEIDGLKI
jgi:hypothetical protein